MDSQDSDREMNLNYRDYLMGENDSMLKVELLPRLEAPSYTKRSNKVDPYAYIDKKTSKNIIQTESSNVSLETLMLRSKAMTPRNLSSEIRINK